MPLRKSIEEGVPEDTEGNMPRIRLPEPAVETGEPETEGNMPRVKLPEPAVETDTAETEDAEGNVFRH
jgi:hypothetical protein